jgi:hypothetical protein
MGIQSNLIQSNQKWKVNNNQEEYKRNMMIGQQKAKKKHEDWPTKSNKETRGLANKKSNKEKRGLANKKQLTNKKQKDTRGLANKYTHSMRSSAGSVNLCPPS